MSYYQLWADDLYRKGKFRDTLKTIEKLGHKSSVQLQRLEYIAKSRRAREAEQEKQRQKENPESEAMMDMAEEGGEVEVEGGGDEEGVEVEKNRRSRSVMPIRLF